MNSGIFYDKRTGAPVQIITRAQTKPTFQEVICYQELTKPYECFVMEKKHFFAEFVKEFKELPLNGRVQIEKREDLPDKQPRISKGVVEEKADEKSEKMEQLLAFFDADTYKEKIKLLALMKEDIDDYMLNNIAASLDLSLQEGDDGYYIIMSELEIRSKYEATRG